MFGYALNDRSANVRGSSNGERTPMTCSGVVMHLDMKVCLAAEEQPIGSSELKTFRTLERYAMLQFSPGILGRRRLV